MGLSGPAYVPFDASSPAVAPPAASPQKGMLSRDRKVLNMEAVGAHCLVRSTAAACNHAHAWCYVLRSGARRLKNSCVPSRGVYSVVCTWLSTRRIGTSLSMSLTGQCISNFLMSSSITFVFSGDSMVTEPSIR